MYTDKAYVNKCCYTDVFLNFVHYKTPRSTGTSRAIINIPGTHNLVFKYHSLLEDTSRVWRDI